MMEVTVVVFREDGVLDEPQVFTTAEVAIDHLELDLDYHCVGVDRWRYDSVTADLYTVEVKGA